MSLEFSGHKTRIVTDHSLTLDGSVMTIGAFDGVHYGHQALIRQAVAQARARQLPAIVWTFDPPPKVFFGRATQLGSLADKLARISRLGPDYIVVASFTRAYCARAPEDFLADLRRHNPRQIFVGADFRFGAKQAGDAGLLAQHFDVTLAQPVRCAGGEVISSTRIRALRDRDAAGAKSLQGCPGMPGLLAGGLQYTDIRVPEDTHG